MRTLLFMAAAVAQLLAQASGAAAQAPGTPAERIDALFARWNGETPGCAVGVDGRDLGPVRRAFGLAELEHRVPATIDTVYEAGSVAKQFTAAAVLLLADEGRLSLDDDVRRFVPELPDLGQPITIRQLLNHTSGLRDWGAVAVLEGWPRGTRIVDNDDVVEIVARQRGLNFAPGAEWLYSNSGYNLAAVIVERVSGETLAGYTERRLFEPLGMTATRWRDDHAAIVPGRAEAYERVGRGYREAMPFEDAHGNGGLLTTVDDLLTWNAALSDDRLGLRLGERLAERGRAGDHDTHYGLGLQHGEVSGQAEIGHGGATGGYRAWLARYPDAGLSVAILCNTAEANTARLGEAVAALFLPAAPTPEPVATDAGRAEALAGLFANSRTGEPLGLIAGPNGLRTMQGQPLQVLGAGQYALGDDRLEIVSEDAFDRLTADGDRVRYRRETPVTPTPETLAGYVGVYDSDEAQGRLTVKLEGRRLTLSQRDRLGPLAPTYADVFAGPAGVIRFERDGSGRVIALHVNNGRVRDMAFRRVD